ncbi:HXXEE domain-containing protein [Streptomyces iconiensis]|uniref:HXXEE domain-containing protein n=1 Tax=Streptomyces iconiensis TaxID=1384038 RepID=A0ABT7AAL5_9ACTN|nr:HXXEE domain-containing protein [Streptomyces iconiensis]MDJ1138383.1 HXXEE domain-containing protein [Streptomyces iconiensis]
MNTQDAEAVGPAVTLGLLAAWTLHDTEEVAMVPRWCREHVPELRKRIPQVPDRVWDRLETIDGREFATAVALVGAVVAGAAVEGQRTGGRSGFYQSALNGFGLHGLAHIAQAVAVRGYTPGVATSPTLVIPFTLWARSRLRKAGVLRGARARDAVTSLAFAAVVTGASHGLARRLVRRG